MAAQYALFGNPPADGQEGKQVLHARIVPSRVIRLDRITEELSSFSSFSSADIKGLLQGLADQLVTHLEDGDEVDLEGIGHFSLSLKCDKRVTSPKQIRSEDVHFKSVNFRCSKTITNQLRGMRIERKPETSKDPLFTKEQRKMNILRFLEREGTVMSSQCMGLNACTRYAALKDINELIREGKLMKLGHRKIAVYVLTSDVENGE